MNRVLNVARMQLVNRQTFIWVPLIILLGSTAIAFALMAAIPGVFNAEINEPMYAGSAQAPLWYFLAIGVTALTYTFPFSQAMSISRRTYYLGTLLVVAGASAVMATIFTIFAAVEKATGGYGINAHIFYLPWIMDNGFASGWAFIFCLTILFFTIGFFFTAIFKRFGMTPLVVTLLVLALAVVGAVALISHQGAWQRVWEVLSGLTPLAGAGLAAIAAVVMSGFSYWALRKMVP